MSATCMASSSFRIPARKGMRPRDPAQRGREKKALGGERSRRGPSASPRRADASLVLSHDGVIRWTGDPVAKLTPGDDKLFEPHVRLLADEQLTGPARDKVEGRLVAWLKATVVRLLGPLMEIETAADLTGSRQGHRLIRWWNRSACCWSVRR